MALIPIMIASAASAGADVMKRIAAPMFGGVMVYPAIYAVWNWNFELRKGAKLVTELQATGPAGPAGEKG